MNNTQKKINSLLQQIATLNATGGILNHKLIEQKTMEMRGLRRQLNYALI